MAPSIGERTIAESVSTHFFPNVMPAIPALASAAPASPPIRACEEDDGMP